MKRPLVIDRCERSAKERILLANLGASRPAVASDDAAQPTLERPEGWRPEGAGETLVANSCGAPQPAVARDDAALLALKDRPVEKTQGSAGDVEEQRLLLRQAAPRCIDVFKRFTRRLSDSALADLELAVDDEGSLRKRRCMELTHRRS